MKPGEPLILFNGEGSAWQGSIAAVSKKAVAVKLESEIESNSESPLQIPLGQSLSRASEWIMQSRKPRSRG